MDKTVIKYLRTIGEINKIISTSKTFDEALKDSLRLIVSSANADYAVIWYVDKDKKLHPYYSICPVDLSDRLVKPNEGIVGKVYETQKPFFCKKFTEEDKEKVDAKYRDLTFTSYVCSPIANDEGKCGAVEFFKKEGEFNDEELNFLEMLPTLASLQISDNEKFTQEWDLSEPIYEIKDVKKSYKTGEFVTHVLQGINLDIYKGEFIVLLGESGCGKSTLLNIIGGMDHLDSGEVFFDKKDISRFNNKELTEYRRKNIGFIFQSYNLMPNLTAKENLDLIGELVEKPMKSEDALNLVGLSDKMNNYPSELSGGQQQRVSIARALVKNPTVIFADEPTAALDYETSIEVLKALEDVYKSGTTLVMVTHNEEIARMANRVVKFRKGKVYEIIVNRKPVHAEDLVW